jgi:putative transposase
MRRHLRTLKYRTYVLRRSTLGVIQGEASGLKKRPKGADCRFTHDDNRHGDHFCYQKCGSEVNAAKNIGLRYARKRIHRLHSSPTSGSGDAEVDLRVNGGT